MGNRFLRLAIGLAFALLLGPILTGCGGNIDNTKFLEGRGDLKGVALSPDGKPLEGVIVQVLHSNKVAVTDEKGNFLLRNVQAGKRELLFRYREELALKLTIWVVGGQRATIKPEQTVLQPVAQLLGKVASEPDWTAKGVTLSIAGTPYKTKTVNKSGTFAFKALPAGCHLLRVESKYFSAKEREICLKPGSTRDLEKPIKLLPQMLCSQEVDNCPEGSVCYGGHCIPEGPGRADLLVKEIDFGELAFLSEASLYTALIKNTGWGKLTVKEIRLINGQNNFSLVDLPRLPHSIPRFGKLAIKIKAKAQVPDKQESIIEIKTDDPKNEVVVLKAKFQVQEAVSNCLRTFPSEVTFDSLEMGKEKEFKIELFNKCTRAVAVNFPPRQGSDSCKDGILSKATPLPHCITSQWADRTLTLQPGEKKEFKFTVVPKGYGVFETSIFLISSEDKRAILEVPLRARIENPSLKVIPEVLNFGQVPPQSTHRLWLTVKYRTAQLLAKVPVNFAHYLKEFSVEGDTSFTLGNEVVIRSPGSPRNTTVYIPVEFKAPKAGSLSQAYLKLAKIPGLDGRPFLIKLKGSVATKSSLSMNAESLFLGASNGCLPLKRELTINNTSKKRGFQISKVSLLSTAPREFKLTLNSERYISPGESRTLGTIQFVPKPNQIIYSFGILQIEFMRDGIPQSPLIISLRGSTGFYHREVVKQLLPKYTRIFTIIDPKVPYPSEIFHSLYRLFSKLKKEKVLFEIIAIGRDKFDLLADYISKYPEKSLLDYLQKSKVREEQPLQALYDAVQKIGQLERNSNAIFLLISSEDDRSPYPVLSYLPKRDGELADNFQIMAAVPFRDCGEFQKAERILRGVKESRGIAMDLCAVSDNSANGERWTRWVDEIVKALQGKRVKFSLRFKPKESSIQLQKGGYPLSRKNWSYDPKTNSVILNSEKVLLPGEKANIFYYTSCSE